MPDKDATGSPPPTRAGSCKFDLYFQHLHLQGVGSATPDPMLVEFLAHEKDPGLKKLAQDLLYEEFPHLLGEDD